MPDAARISDHHDCPKPGHGGPIHSGSNNVIVGYLPAARVGDAVICTPVGASDKVSQGSSTVVINYRQAARKTDPCAHGSTIVAGCPTVIIGDSPQSFALRAAARRGTPLCEDCERRKLEVLGAELTADPGPPDPHTATLDDDRPPPLAHRGVDNIAAATAEQEALASQPDQGDGLDGERLNARLAVAFKFLVDPRAGQLKPSKVTAHLRGIDAHKPVEVVPVQRRTLYQRGMPGADNGQYFSLDQVDPAALGASTLVYPRIHGTPTPPAVPRDSRVITFDETPAKGLQSTAAPIDDDWSMPSTAEDPGQTVPCSGGATQIMVPRTFHGGTTTAFL